MFFVTLLEIYTILLLLQILNKQEALYEEILGLLYKIEQRSTSLGQESSTRNELYKHIIELKDQLIKERDDSQVSMQIQYVYTVRLGVIQAQKNSL